MNQHDEAGPSEAAVRKGHAILMHAKRATGEFRLPVEGGAMLRPISTRPGELNAGDVARLTAWRNRFRTSFLDEFEATEVHTARWLTKVVGPDEGKILFMLDDVDGRSVGYMGLAFIDWSRGSGEGDAVVRGEASSAGTVTHALRTMFVWAQDQLNLREIRGRARSDNPALAYFLKFGYTEVKRVPLQRAGEGSEQRWVEGGDDRSLELVHLYLTGACRRE